MSLIHPGLLLGNNPGDFTFSAPLKAKETDLSRIGAPATKKNSEFPSTQTATPLAAVIADTGHSRDSPRTDQAFSSPRQLWFLDL